MHSSYFHREDPDSSLHERMVFIPFMKGKPMTSGVPSGCVWPRSGCLCCGGGSGKHRALKVVFQLCFVLS